MLWLFTGSTVAELAERISGTGSGIDDLSGEAALDILVPLRSGGSKAPLFCLHPVLGVSWAFAGLASHIDRERAIYGLQSPGLSGGVMPESIEEWAGLYLDTIRAVQPEGPYHLIGWSLGGQIAHAMATQLQAAGEEVALLALMDSYAEPVDRGGDKPAMTVGDLLGGLAPALVSDGADEVLTSLTAQELSEDLMSAVLAQLPAPFDTLGTDRVGAMMEAVAQAGVMGDGYRPMLFKGDVLYFAALSDDPSATEGASTWRDSVDGRIETIGIDAGHWEMASPSALARIARSVEDFWSATEDRG